MSLNCTIGPGFGLMSSQHKTKFDNKIDNTRSINISKNKILNKNDKGKVHWRGTQFDLMEKNWQPMEIYYFFRICSILEK